MSTEAQIIANRRNSQKSKILIHRESTGPRSPEGKAVVSKNAVKHGLFASEAGKADIRRPVDQDEGNQETRESGRIALITRYSDNHCLVTRYPDAHYKLCKTKPICAGPNGRKLLCRRGL